jgi:glycosyltransferase involved in cell wall biosynthesis
VKYSLGLAIITKNEARVIEQCIRSVPFATEVIVVDSHSIDQTREIAVRCGAKVIERDWPGYSEQKQFALEQISSDWILCLDADECLTEAAQKEIQCLFAQKEFQEVGFRIPRYHVFMNQVIRHGKGVDFPLRLIRKGSARYSDRSIHEELLTDGKVGQLKAGMIHYSSPSFVARLQKMKRDVMAEDQYFIGNPGNVTVNTLFFIPIRHFFSYLFRHEGWKDGPKGWLVTLLSAIQLFWIQFRFFKFKLSTKKSESG